MKKILFPFVLILLIVSCKSQSKSNILEKPKAFSSLSIDSLFKDEISIRAIAIAGNEVWYAGSKSKYGYYDLEKKQNNQKTISGDNLEFRSLAQNDSSLFLLNVGSPAFLYKIDKHNLSNKVVYQENHEKVFYDSMQFWNEKEGIAMGDPIANCLSVIITRDGGNSWKKISCGNLPTVVSAEAAFAASNTNIVIKENNTWIVTGGKEANVIFSSDKGKSWKKYSTPIMQGEAMTGIFTADFYDTNQGFISGGNYEKLTQNYGNKAHTVDGGKTWDLISENEGFGYASCVQYIPNSGGKGLVTVGASGIYYSNDAGKKWKQLSINANLYTIRFIDENTAIAAGKNCMLQLRFL